MSSPTNGLDPGLGRFGDRLRPTSPPDWWASPLSAPASRRHASVKIGSPTIFCGCFLGLVRSRVTSATGGVFKVPYFASH